MNTEDCYIHKCEINSVFSLKNLKYNTYFKKKSEKIPKTTRNSFFFLIIPCNFVNLWI